MSDIVEYDPWHGDPGNAVAPHRPSLAQLGGGAYEDDQSDPPDLDTMPSAAMENVNQKVLAGIARTADVAAFSVKFNAGAPYIDKATFADKTLVIGDFTVTDNGIGQTDITWPADTFPVAATEPMLGLNAIVGVRDAAAWNIANGVRVNTFDDLGIGVDCAFTVTLK